MSSTIRYEDRWGDVIHRPDDDLVEIRWFDTTSEMQRDTFKVWLATFAGVVEEIRPSGALTDATSFGMPSDRMDGPWRDANIIPRYNAAGLRRFAFVMPSGMPAVGSPPSHEGPADFPTAYFDRRAAALEWLTGG